MTAMAKIKSSGIKRFMQMFGFHDQLKAYADAVEGYKKSANTVKLDIIAREVINFFPMIKDFLDQEDINNLLISLEYSIDNDPAQKAKLEKFLQMLPIILAIDVQNVSDIKIK